MAPNPRPIENAPAAGRRLLGVLLAQRRAELGYTHRPAFTRARLPLTPSGNPNTRLVADIEEAYRDNFPDSRLRQLARAYLVDYRSLLDVAHLRHNLLIPLPADSPEAQAGGTSPFDPARSAQDRPWFDELNERRVALAARGITDPDGAQMFPADPEAARAWDSIAAYGIPPGDKVWVIADLRRRAAARNAGPEANSHGA